METRRIVGLWHCPLCTAVIPVNPFIENGKLEQRVHIDEHLDAGDDYTLGLC